MADEAKTEKTDEELAAQVKAAAGGSTVPDVETTDEADLDWASEGGDEAPIDGGEPAEQAAGDEERKEPTIQSVEESGTFATVPETTKVRKLTAYVVLESVNVKIGDEPVEMWRRVGVAEQTFEGPKALDQAHDVLAKLGRGEHGALVPIPERSWRPKRPVEKPRPPVVGWEGR